MHRFTCLSTGVVLLLLVMPRSTFAHTAWLEEDPATPGVFRVLFGGHAGQLETLEPTKIRAIDAYTQAGQSVSVERADGKSGSRVTLPPEAALITMSYDNGVWTRDPMGRSVNSPLKEVPGAKEATWAMKFHKTVVSWGPVATQPVGQAFEVVPLSARQPVAGAPMSLRVLIDGKAASGVRLGHGEDDDSAITNADGVASFVPRSGLNRLWAGQRRAVDEPTHTELSYEYLLAFEALPAP